MDSDLAVISRILEGQVDLFDVLVRRHESGVFAVVGRRVPRGDVETVAQDVFVSAYRSLATYAGRQPFEGWLFRIARRRCCDYWREQERHGGRVTPAPDDAHQAWLDRVSAGLAEEALDRECARREAAEVVGLALGRLGAEDRALMESLYFEDVPPREVAAALDWSLAKVKVRAFRVRKRMETVIQAMLKRKESR